MALVLLTDRLWLKDFGMTDIFMNWLLLVTVFGVAVVSPGPDLVMAIRNSLQSRRAGLFTALGFGLAVLLHVTYTIAGLAAVIAKSILLFSILKYAGAAYLFYVGIKALRSRGMNADEAEMQAASPRAPMTDLMAVRSGFITNLFNPKATMFFLALFSQIIHPEYSIAIQAAFGITCSLMVIGWFSIVSIVLNTPKIRAKFMRASKWIDRTCGAFFLALGVRLALTKAAA